MAHDDLNLPTVSNDGDSTEATATTHGPSTLDLPQRHKSFEPPAVGDAFVSPENTASNDDGRTDEKSQPVGEDEEDSASHAIEQYMKEEGIFVGADGDLLRHYAAAVNAEDIAELGASSAPTEAEIVDSVHLRDGFLMSGLKVSLRNVRRLRSKERKKAIIEEIVRKLAPEEREAAAETMLRFCARIFHNDPEIACAVMLHFIYQVKRKLARLPVSDHLMPIFLSTQQGVGKSRAVKRFLAPMGELAKSVRLSDLADPRSIFMFRHPVLVVDDMEIIERKAVANLKNRMTDDTVRGRGMQSNYDVGTEQLATFIGTSNESVMDTVPDPTGHRRFFELSFRNGNIADGGDPEIWKAVTGTDFLPIWQSVDPFAPSPIEAVRDRVFGKAGPRQPKSKVHAWALGLDLESEPFRRVVEDPGVQAQRLFDLYAEQRQDAWMSIKQFGILMREATRDENVPLDWPKRRPNAMYFPLKRAK